MPQKIPLADWINYLVDKVVDSIGPQLRSFSDKFGDLIEGLTDLLEGLPWWLIIAVTALLAYKSGKWKMAVGVILGLCLIYNLNLWDHMLATFVLVIISSLISMIIGLPLGILCARSNTMQKIISPVLDLMQTMPAFVYLVPVLILFNIGVVPAVFSTVVFAMPPVTRLTRLGIQQVPEDLIEAASSFGATKNQLLWKVQIPLALDTIKAGVNQTVMMSLSMVVVAAMIGAGGLGGDVMTALASINVGTGVEAGICIVILAVTLDRITQKMNFKPRHKSTTRKSAKK
jgi:glycine betaine/proline transport system permease protein